MVEICPQGELPGEDVLGVEVDGQGASARSRLGVIGLDATDERLRVLKREISLQGQVVADTRLRAAHLQYRVETYDFIARAYGQTARCGLHHLPGRGIECQGALVFPLHIELEVILQCAGHTDQRRETFGDGHRRDVVWR